MLQTLIFLGNSALVDVFDLKYISFIKLDSMSNQQMPKFVGERNLLVVLLLVFNVFLNLSYIRKADGKRAETALPCKFCVGLEGFIAPF